MTAPLPAFFIITARIRTEQHSSRFQRRPEFQQHAWRLLARYVKQRCIGEDTVKMGVRQIKLEKILLPYLDESRSVRPLSLSVRHPHHNNGIVMSTMPPSAGSAAGTDAVAKILRIARLRMNSPRSLIASPQVG
jgi:hypothetical protein